MDIDAKYHNARIHRGFVYWEWQLALGFIAASLPFMMGKDYREIACFLFGTGIALWIIWAVELFVILRSYAFVHERTLITCFAVLMTLSFISMMATVSLPSPYRGLTTGGGVIFWIVGVTWFVSMRRQN